MYDGNVSMLQASHLQRDVNRLLQERDGARDQTHRSGLLNVAADVLRLSMYANILHSCTCSGSIFARARASFHTNPYVHGSISIRTVHLTVWQLLA